MKEIFGDGPPPPQLPPPSQPVPPQPVPPQQVLPVEFTLTCPPVLDALGDGDLLDALVAFERAVAQINAVRAGFLAELAGRASARAQSGAEADATSGSAARLAAFPVSKREELERRSLIAEIACATRTPEGTVSRLINDAETLVAELPQTLAALRAGEIWYRHAQVLLSHSGSLPPEARAGFEETVLPDARVLTAAMFDHRARRHRERVHPDSISVRSVAAQAERYVQLEPDRDGMAYLHAWLPAVDAHRIDDALSWYAARAHTDGDTRTTPQRRADALTDLILRPSASVTTQLSPHTGPTDMPALSRDLADHATATGTGTGTAATDTRPAHPTVIVTVPISTLLGTTDQAGHLDGYGPIDADTARGLAANAPSLLRMITDPDTGDILTLGRKRYRPPRHLQLALHLDDETCRFPACNRRATGCEIDHTTPWENGGTTDPGNLAHLCPKHHHLKHETRWTVQQHPGRQLQWISPNRREYVTTAAPRLREEPVPF